MDGPCGDIGRAFAARVLCGTFERSSNERTGIPRSSRVIDALSAASQRARQAY
jgi:hypothetical protein